MQNSKGQERLKAAKNLSYCRLIELTSRSRPCQNDLFSISQLQKDSLGPVSYRGPQQHIGRCIGLQSVNSESIPKSTVSWQSIDNRVMVGQWLVNSRSTMGPMSAECWLSVS